MILWLEEQHFRTKVQKRQSVRYQWREEFAPEGSQAADPLLTPRACRHWKRVNGDARWLDDKPSVVTDMAHAGR